MIERRQFIRYAGASFLAVIGGAFVSGKDTYQAQTATGSVKIQWLGHTCFLFTGNGLRVLVNPFDKLGCTAGYQLPKVEADLVLASSFLLDEGAVEKVAGKPQVLTKSGDYQVKGVKFQGISINHDREGGRRFGQNIAWRWNQGGINILHLGGAAAPIEIEQKILMGNPDLILVPVGGGAKAYNAQEAMAAIAALKPKVVIPTQYLTEAADKNSCDLSTVDNFLELAKDMQISRLNTDAISIRPSDLPKEGTVVRVFSDSAIISNK